MNIIVGVLIFTLVLFIYIHVYYQFKTSNDREIYTLEEPQKDRLEKIANLRQPFVFQRKEISNFEKTLSNEHLNIRTTEYPSDDEELFLPLPFNDATALFKKESKYITENNFGLPLCKHVDELCDFLKPTLNWKTKIDFWSGSENTNTPLRFFLNFRNYLYILEGEVNIKLIKPEADIEKTSDYDYLEFRTRTNPWTEEIGEAMEFKATKGDVIFIPAYWWNSVKYGKSSRVLLFQYITYTNALAISPHLIRHVLQRQNIKHRTLKKMKLEIPETSKNDSDEEDNPKKPSQ